MNDLFFTDTATGKRYPRLKRQPVTTYTKPMLEQRLRECRAEIALLKKDYGPAVLAAAGNPYDQGLGQYVEDIETAFAAFQLVLGRLEAAIAASAADPS